MTRERHNPSEQKMLDGICPDCGGKLQTVWTAEKIKEVKDDLGMSDDDDFGDCCQECAKNYMPIEVWNELYSDPDYATKH